MLRALSVLTLAVSVLAVGVELRAAPVPRGPFPEPFRTAVRVLDPGRLAALDAAAGPPEAALESLAVGPARDRAVRAARFAGVRDAHRYRAHRAFLPETARQLADRAVVDVMTVGTALDLRWPLDAPARVSSPYGPRIHPVDGVLRLHNGLDLALPIGTPILSSGDGRVVRGGHDARSGRYVVVDHGWGVETVYCHLDEIEVRRGQEVRWGERVARSGNTGRTTGPHLHWIVRVGRRTVDPAVLRQPEAAEQLARAIGR